MNRPPSETGSGPEPDMPAGRRTFPLGVLRPLLLFEASTFVAAAAVHFGVLLEVYGHRTCSTPGPAGGGCGHGRAQMAG
jgi:hypothetical protein